MGTLSSGRGKPSVASLPLRVVLDTNVLFPFSLRDTLLRAAAAGYFQIYWSENILDEASRNLVQTRAITEEQAKRLMYAMTSAFPEAMVKDYESLIASMPNDEEDRHVAAVAVKAEAQIIVTNNVRHFRSVPEGVDVYTADDFLRDLFGLDPGGVIELLRDQAAALTRPPRSFEELLSGLAKSVPSFVSAVRERTALP